MENLELDMKNIDKATGYLESIGRMQEFKDKHIEPAHWYAVIQFSNLCLFEKTNK